jgi:hypothetical protein
MAKQKVKEYTDEDWIEKLDGMCRQEAIDYLMTLPGNCYLEDLGHYDYGHGEIYVLRDETDEEESTREAEELAEKVKQEARKQLAQETAAEHLARLQDKENALFVYLKQHENNPQRNDLENLFRTVMNLEEQGIISATIPLKECMKRIENYEQ